MNGYMALGVLIFSAWLLVAIVLAYGVGYTIHRHECPDLDDAIEEAHAAVADVEAADCRLWELECGWQS